MTASELRSELLDGWRARRLRSAGVAAMGLVWGLLVAEAPATVVIPGLLLLGVLLVGHPQTATTLAIVLLFSNAGVIAVKYHGLPGLAAGVLPLLLCITLAHRVFVEHRGLVVPHAMPWLVMFTIVQAVGTVASRDPQLSAAALNTFLVEGFALYLLVVNTVRSFEALRLAALALVLTAGALGSLTLFQEATHSNSSRYGGFAQMSKATIDTSHGRTGRQRHAGAIGEQNRWAQCLVLVVPIAIAIGTRDRSKTMRIVAWTSLAGIASGIVLTYSRGAAVGLGITLLVAVLLRWVKPWVGVASAAAAVILLAIFAPAFLGRASTLVNSSDQNADPFAATAPDSSITNRSTEAAAAAAVFGRHPVVGVGTGLFPTYFQVQARTQGASRIVGVNREAHDLYLGLAAETGALGLGSFCGFAIATVRACGTVRRRPLGGREDVAALVTGFALSVVAYLATGLFLHFAYIRYFWLFAALAAAAAIVGREPAAAGGRAPAMEVARHG